MVFSVSVICARVAAPRCTTVPRKINCASCVCGGESTSGGGTPGSLRVPFALDGEPAGEALRVGGFLAITTLLSTAEGFGPPDANGAYHVLITTRNSK